MFKGISGPQVKMIEANRDKVQDWYDKNPHLYRTAAEHRFTKIEFPDFILKWGIGELKINTKSMDKDYLKHARFVSFIFWDVELHEIQKLMDTIKFPELCVKCGQNNNLSLKEVSISQAATIPDTAHIYSFDFDKPKLQLWSCPDPNCNPDFILSAAYQNVPGMPHSFENANFLQLSLIGIESKKVYLHLAKNNAEIMVPYFKVLNWRQIQENDLVKALQNQKHIKYNPN